MKQTDIQRRSRKFSGILQGDGRFLTPCFASLGVGVAVLDEELRVKAISRALAAMNGLPVEAHLGKTPGELLGSFAEEIQPYFEKVFSGGEPVIFEAKGSLPSRKKPGHWIETFIPVRNQDNRIVNLLALVLEVTEQKKLEEALFGLAGRLTYVKENLRSNLREIVKSQGEYTTQAETDLFRSLEVIEQCTTDIAEVLRMVGPLPLVRKVREEHGEPRTGTEPLRGIFAASPLTPGVLTARENQVLCLLAGNLSNKQVAGRLGISVRTVESHRRRVMEKLGLHSFGELLHYAIRCGLVEP